MSTLSCRVTALLSFAFSFAVAVHGSAAPAHGQTGAVSGTVHSEVAAPVPFAAVGLRRSADSVLVAESVTAANGAFRITGVLPGIYLLEVSHLGYRTALRSGVTITGSAPHVDLGIIRLEPGAIALQGVDVSVARAPIAILPDRNVYSTSDMAAAAGGTAIDVLRNVPELDVTIEGSVTSRGATPSIHINGRPAPMQGEALDRYLQQLPAERIDRIEVISNPSARYEAGGQGGIVNIVMKRGISIGLGGSVAVDAGTRNQRGGSGNLHYQEGRLTVFGGASASFSGSERASSDLRENLTTQPTTFIQQDSRDRSSGRFASADLAAELKVGTRGTVWTDLGFGRNVSDTDVFSAYTHLDHVRNPTQRYDRLNDRNLHGFFGSATLGYGKAGEARGNEWSVELRRSFNDHDDTSESSRRWLSPDGAALGLAPELTFAGAGQDRTGFSVEANLMRSWGSSGQVETGYRGSWTTSRNDFRIDVEAPADPGADAGSVGDFRHRERIHAAFVSASQQIRGFRVQLGLRGEQAHTRSDLPMSGESFENSQLDLFPNANISTRIRAGGQLRLSYSRRVDRPGTATLNPASPNLDPMNRQVGNPYLQPRHTHSITLTASQTGRLGSLQLAPFYRRTADSWDQVRTVNEAGVSTVTWQNLATITSYGGSINASLTPLGVVSGFVSVRGYRELRDASNLRREFSGSSIRFSVVSNASVRVNTALNLQGMLTYLPARDLPQGRISSMIFTTLGARQQLWDGRGSIHVSVVDPFELQRFRFTTSDGTHIQIGNSTLSARRATVGMSYSFGRDAQSNRRRGTAEENENPVQRIR